MTLPYHAPQTPPEVALLVATLSPDDAAHFEAAYRFAAAAHDGQTRDEGTPYIEHPVRVARILWEELGVRDLDVLVAALNHDVLEDCDWLEPEVLNGALGVRATGIIEEVTKPQVSEARKAERDRDYLERLRSVSTEARLLKLADRMDNLRSVVSAGNPDKARRYLSVSREEFLPLALATDPVAAELVTVACDDVERYLAGQSEGTGPHR